MMERAAKVARDGMSMVRYCMDKYPRARESDQFLVLAVWHEQGIPKLPETTVQWILTHGMRTETVRRHRQELISRGYTPRIVEEDLFTRYGDKEADSGDKRGADEPEGGDSAEPHEGSW